MHLQASQPAFLRLDLGLRSVLKQAMTLLQENAETLDTSLRKRLHHGKFTQSSRNLVPALDKRPRHDPLGVVLDFAADFCDLLFQSRKLGSQTAASLVSRQVILRLMFGAIQIIAHRFKLLECDIDRAVVTAREEQCTLAIFEILLYRRPSRCADAEPGA